MLEQAAIKFMAFKAVGSLFVAAKIRRITGFSPPVRQYKAS